MVYTAVAAAEAIFAAFVDALLIAVAIAEVMDAMNVCMRLAKAAAAVPGLIAAGLAAGGCLL